MICKVSRWAKLRSVKNLYCNWEEIWLKGAGGDVITAPLFERASLAMLYLRALQKFHVTLLLLPYNSVIFVFPAVQCIDRIEVTEIIHFFILTVQSSLNSTWYAENCRTQILDEVLSVGFSYESHKFPAILFKR